MEIEEAGKEMNLKGMEDEGKQREVFIECMCEGILLY
jgi:hypothetical protein